MKPIAILQNTLVLIFISAFLSINVHSQVTINSENFNSGFGIWIDGGTNCELRDDNRPNNTQAVRLGGATSGSSMQTNNLNLTTYGSVTFSFEYEGNSMENGESFEVQYSSNGGSDWTTLTTYVSGTDFNNGTDYLPIITLLGSNYTFTTNSRFRIINTIANSTSNDYIHIDNIVITGYAPTPEIDVTGNDISIIGNGTNTPILSNNTDFGTAQIVSETITKTFVIENTGTADLTLGNISLSGTTDFTLDSFPSSGTVIPSGGSENIVVSFSSSSTGSQNDVLTILSDDSNEASYEINLKAEATKVFFDSDNDGILDDQDIDDDNDGIIDSDEENNCNASPVSFSVNYKFLEETFGTGTNRTTINTSYAALTDYCWEDGTGDDCKNSASDDADLDDGEYTVYYKVANGDGINQTPNDELASWADGLWYTGDDHTPGDTNGRMAVFNASVEPGVFYTAKITGALPNVPVTYSFYALNLDRWDHQDIDSRIRPDIRVEFQDLNGNLLDNLAIPGAADAFFETGDIAPWNPSNPDNGWFNYSENLILSVNEFQVIFINNAPGGLGNDLAIDDIVVRQTLCDMDGDGVADVFDLDSDNDGIPDVVEANTTAADLSEGKGHLTGVATWVDANGNGMHDSLEAEPAIDTDADGIPDYLDLDSDNDGLFDVDESGTFNSNNPYPGFVNGDGDITGDGVGDGPESETFREKDSDGNGSIEGYGDGILDIFDYHQGNTNYTDSYGNNSQGTGPLYALDSDNDGIPDYRDPYNDLTGIYDIDTVEIYAHLPNTNGVLDDTTDADGDGIMASRDGDDTVFGSPRNLDNSYSLYFDGRNDYVEDSNVIPSGDATVMAFIKPDGPNTNGNNQVIAGQGDLYLRLNDATNTISAIVEGTTITSTTTLTDGIWAHVAVTTRAGETILYINGVQEASDTSGGINDASNFSIGKATSSNNNYFKGEIDEVRVFNIALATDELKRMVYQELDETNSFNRGKIIPLDISPSIGSNLVKYYKMDGYRDDILDDKTTGTTDVAGAQIFNIKDIYFQRAPLPYVTASNGDWSNTSSWVNGSEWDIMNKQDNPDDASIVHIQHDIILDGSYDTQGTVGIIVDSGNEFSITADKGLYNSFYVKLDGKIDLDGESQLIQTENSVLDVTSSGVLERDQQGTRDLFTYNYWSSPVGISNATTNNNSYTVPDVLLDGTTASSPISINFLTSGYNGNNSSSPISIADYWIWKYSNRLSDTYSEWQHVRSTGTLLAGEGFTMKGVQNTSGNITLQQNYVFNGKPNNGDITLTISSGNDYLIGNPYPSALDANEFIYDNIQDGAGRASANIINGALYFWDHFASSTHVLANYEGGYATYTLMGGAPAISNDTRIAATGQVGTKIPGRYVPISQGFFVSAILDPDLADDGLTSPVVGGTVTFKNSQRAFITEASGSSLFVKQGSSKLKKGDLKSDNVDNRQKIRLMLDSPKGYHRQLLAGVDENATNAFDIGYDAPLIETNEEDMFWVVKNKNFVIQAVDNFGSTQKLPLGVKTNKVGITRIKIETLENIEDNLEIYLYDKELDLYHDLKENAYEVYLQPGEHLTRFEVAFKNSEEQSLDVVDIINDKKIHLLFSNEKESIIVHNPNLEQLKSVEIINLLGQSIYKFNLNSSENYMEYKTNPISTGAYLIKIQTSEGIFSKKILIK